MMTSCYLRALIVSDGHRERNKIQDLSLEAVSDLTLKHTPFPYLMLSKTVLSLFYFSMHVIFRSASFNNRL